MNGIVKKKKMMVAKMMNGVIELLGLLLGFVFIVVFLQGTAEREEKYLFVNCGVGALISGCLKGGFPALCWLLIGLQALSVIRGDVSWKKGSAIYRGGVDFDLIRGRSYEIKVKSGEEYLLVKIKNGRVLYYDGVDDLLSSWDIGEGLQEIKRVIVN